MKARSLTTKVGSYLPHGWGDLGRQLAVFALLDIAYELSRTLAAGDRATAIRNAHSIVGAERGLGLFHELAVQRFALHAPSLVMDIANWTYFNCQFTLTFGFVLWVYLRRNDHFARLRNLIAAVNLIGLVGYVLYPAAPPRMLTGLGFVDSLDQTGVNQHSGLIAALANPYAAMPSLHTAYAITVAATGLAVTRGRLRVLWLAYPALVVFSIIATANHFVLDACAGAGVAAAAFAIVSPRTRRAVAVAALAGLGAVAAARAARAGDSALAAIDGAAVELLVLAVVLNLASVAAKTSVWRRTIAATPGGAGVRHRDLVPGVFIGFLFNTALPARLGEVAKLAVVGRTTRRRGLQVGATALAGSLAAEQVVLVAALVVVAGASALATAAVPAWAAATLAALSTCVIAAWVLAARLERLAARIPGPLGPAAAETLRHARAAFAGPDRGLAALGLGAVSWAFQLAGIMLTLQAFSLPHSVAAACAVFVASTLVGAVPLVPGNVGVFSAAVVAALAPFGVHAEAAAAFGLALQGVEAVLSLAVGGLFLAYEGLSFADLRREVRPAAEPAPVTALGAAPRDPIPATLAA
jgi:uncharacterized membrane protein YbhN (UPF0104 family)